MLGAALALLACGSKDERTAVVQNQDPRELCASNVMTGNGIGDLAVGTPVDSVTQLCRVIRDTVELDNEAMPSRVLFVLVGSDTVKAEINSGKVWRIQIATQEPRTVDSLGVGTALSRMLELRQPKGWWGEGAIFLVSPQHCGLSFELSAKSSDVPPGDLDYDDLSRLPNATVVRRVLIVGCGRTGT